MSQHERKPHETAHDDAWPAVDDDHPHVTPVSTLLAVFGALLALTALTVGVTYVDLGPFNLWIALLVAASKSAVVVLYFMHLRWENAFFGQILIGSLFFVALFIGIALVDTTEYRPEIDAASPPGAAGRP